MTADPLATLRDPARLAALDRTGLLDSPTEAAFDRLARLAAKIIKAPVALVTLVSGDRQFFKSCLGLPEPWNSWRQTPLSHSFCQHVVAGRVPLIIDDAREHPLVRENAAIRDLGVIAYLGIPLVTPDGHALGSFCVIDHVPRAWSPDDVDFLQTLAASVMTEIGLRHALAEARRAAELEYFRALVENALDVIVVVDASGTIRYESPSVVRVFGYTAQERIGQSVLELIHPEDRPRVEALFERGPEERGRGGIRFEVRIQHRDGSWRVLEGVGENFLHEPQVAGIVLNYRDITERKQAEDALRQTRGQLEEILRVVPAFVYVLRIEAERLVPTWISPAITRLLGYEPDDWLTSPDWWAARIHSEDRPRTLGSQARLQTEGRLVHQYRFRHKDGTYRWILDALQIVRTPAGQPTEIVGVWLDVTEAKRTEDRLQQAERLAALGRLAAGVAHELRNPLTVVTATTGLLDTQLAKGHTPSVEAMQRQTARLQEATARMQRIMEGLSLYSKPPKPEPQRLNVGALLAATVELVAYEARKGRVTVTVDAPPGLPAVLGDRSQFMQVFLNLANNAVEAMAEAGGGTLVLRARPDETRATVVVEVADTGPGIPLDKLADIWEPFYTTKAEGTGLGLSIVRSLVGEQPGATVTVESEPGRGTTFRITFPGGDSA